MQLMICPLGHIPQQGTEETPAGTLGYPLGHSCVSNEHPVLSCGFKPEARKTELRQGDRALRRAPPSAAGCLPLPRLFCLLSQLRSPHPCVDWVLAPLIREGVIFLYSISLSASQKCYLSCSWQTTGGGYLTTSSPKTQGSTAIRSILPLGPILSN